MRPRGTPPMPSARSSDSAPVGIAATRTCAPGSPIRMTVPLPNSRSIWVSAPSRAAARAFAALSTSVTVIGFTAPVTLNRGAHHRGRRGQKKLIAAACLQAVIRGAGPRTTRLGAVRRPARPFRDRGSLALQRDPNVGRHERGDIDRPDQRSAGAETDELAVGAREGTLRARVATGVDAEGVLARLERDLHGFVDLVYRAGAVAVEFNLEWTAAQLHERVSAYHSERC